MVTIDDPIAAGEAFVLLRGFQADNAVSATTLNFKRIRLLNVGIGAITRVVYTSQLFPLESKIGGVLPNFAIDTPFP